MQLNPHAGQYREIEIKTATPTELVVLLYDAAIANLQKAEQHLFSREIQKRVHCLNQTTLILTELQAALNFEAGGEIAGSLDRLYGYMRNRVFQANLQQDAAPLQEIMKLLQSLRTAWQEVAQAEIRKTAGRAAPETEKSAAAVAPVRGTHGAPALAGFNITA